MPRKGYTSWDSKLKYGAKQRETFAHIEYYLKDGPGKCKETCSLREIRIWMEIKKISVPTMYRVLRKMEELMMVEILKDEKTCRVTIRNLLR
jgi:hypothetical protein